MSADPKPFIDFRNAYPTNFVWNHPTATFNGATNTFLPVTTLRLGLDEARYGALPDISQGVIRLPTGAGTTTWPKEVERKYIESWNLTVQHQITTALTGQIGYVGTRVKGQMGFININASAPGTGNAGRPLALLGIVSDINSIQPFGDAFYDGLQTQLTGRWGGSLFGAAYTWSKAINYQDNDANPRIPWPGAIERNRGLANYDRTHNFQAYWVLESPFGPGQRWLTEGLAGALLGDWQVNGVLSVMSGTPIFIVQNNAGNLNAAGSGSSPTRCSRRCRSRAASAWAIRISTGRPLPPSTFPPASRSASAMRGGTPSAGRDSSTWTSACSARSESRATTCSSGRRRSTH
jgi:hypothetical protein